MNDDSTTCTDSSLCITLDTVLETLANQRRRFILYTLVDIETDTVGLETLIEDVVTLEVARTDGALTRDHYLEVATDLYHWHLPVLADIGIIESDLRSQTIRYWNHPLLETWTARVRREELSSSNHP